MTFKIIARKSEVNEFDMYFNIRDHKPINKQNLKIWLH